MKMLPLKSIKHARSYLFYCFLTRSIRSSIISIILINSLVLDVRADALKWEKKFKFCSIGIVEKIDC